MDADILNLLLHTVYGMAADPFGPSLVTIKTVIEIMPIYGYSPGAFLAPSTTLYSLVVSHAPASPLECYILAASLDLMDLAVAVSPYLPKISPSEITDKEAEEMGPLYLKRLFFLHLGRNEALKRLLSVPPDSHSATPVCGTVDQDKLRRSWMLAVASLTWDPQPGR